MTDYSFLASPCSALCSTHDCPDAVSQDPRTERWFITMGHAGFNSPANNRDGYTSRERALAAHRRYAGR